MPSDSHFRELTGGDEPSEWRLTGEQLVKVSELLAERDRYRQALEEIANQDFRGNRSTESQIAWKALNA